MRILLTNDDGINAPGIQALKDGLKDHDITVCAPSSQRSASSHSVTYFFGDHTFTQNGRNMYAIDGTPADCVYFALQILMDQKPDLIISGINQGQNLSDDVIYSGTVGAASEGMMAGIPSIAVSLCSYTSTHFDACVKAVKKVMHDFMNDPERCRYVMNINVPAVNESDIKGFRVTHLEGRMDYMNRLSVIKQNNQKGIIHVERMDVQPKQLPGEQGGDVTAVRQGYISLTPIGSDLTIQNEIKQMRQYECLQWN